MPPTDHPPPAFPGSPYSQTMLRWLRKEAARPPRRHGRHAPPAAPKPRAQTDAPLRRSARRAASCCPAPPTEPYLSEWGTALAWRSAAPAAAEWGTLLARRSAAPAAAVSTSVVACMKTAVPARQKAPCCHTRPALRPPPSPCATCATCALQARVSGKGSRRHAACHRRGTLDARAARPQGWRRLLLACAGPLAAPSYPEHCARARPPARA